MKKFLIMISICLISLNSLSASEFEFGLILGSPAGLSAKLWNDQRTAFDFGLGWSNYDNDRFDNDNDRVHLHSDYLIHRFDLIPVDQGRLGLYYGIGARIVADKDLKFGARIPLGACYNFPEVPLVIFLELVPVVDIMPELNISPDIGIGVRYLFGKNPASAKNKGQLKKKSDSKKEDKDEEDKEDPKVKLQW
ncbi:MAG: hypothetical protein KKD38_07790 [Candidatus Delongbacteria bacterium]|nr:hypothetical protein [Candidatus Delongbacteria bacterium]MCG2761161.1 hypothetical protein [Candidatus Delongbacteria bacterium]